MTANVDQVKKTIRDLLRLSENAAATEGEIDNAIRFARRLMDAHHLQEDDVRHDPHAAAADRETMDHRQTYSASRNLTIWEGGLAQFVAELVGSVGYFFGRAEYQKRDNVIVFDDKGEPARRCGIHYYGPAEDVALACDLFDTLHQTIAATGRLKYGGALKGPGRSYAEGFVMSLDAKLEETRRADAAANETSRALIVRSTAIAEATRARANAWLAADQGIELQTRMRRAGGELHDDAFGEGKADGRSAKIDARRKSKITGSTQRRLT